MKKTYLSRSMTRAWATEHPVGDPFGGPAYGEKNDPISAALSIGTMLFTAEAAFAGSLMAGVAFGGAALSLVGNVTGNQTLSKIGMVAGLVGGAGMAGFFGEAAQGATWGSAFGAEAAAGAPASLSGTPTPGAQTPVVEGGATTSPVRDAISNVNTPNVNAPGAAAPNVNTPGGAASSLNAGPGAPAPGSAAYLNLESGLTPPGPSALSGAPANTFGQTAGAAGPNAAAGPSFMDSMKAGNYMDAAKGVGSEAMDMLKNNPTGAYVAAQAVGGVANWLSGKTDAEIDALKANTGYANARALEIQAAIDKEKLRRANLNAGYTTINPQSQMTVNPNAVIQQPWAPQTNTANTGLIAGARG